MSFLSNKKKFKSMKYCSSFSGRFATKKRLLKRILILFFNERCVLFDFLVMCC